MELYRFKITYKIKDSKRHRYTYCDQCTPTLAQAWICAITFAIVNVRYNERVQSVEEVFSDD